MDLQGRTAVIAGAADGTDLAMARRLSADGVRVVLARLARVARDHFSDVRVLCSNAGIIRSAST